MTDFPDRSPIAVPLPLSQPSRFRRFFEANRASLGTLAALIVMMSVFTVANPGVFLHWPIYQSVLVTLPIQLFLVIPLVFVITVGDIDLSFPATMGFTAWVFALLIKMAMPPLLAVLGALLAGAAVGAAAGVVVVYGRLSSLVATLGINFMLRGFILIVTQGKAMELLELQHMPIHAVMTGTVGGVPAQILWAGLFAVFSGLLYHCHRFGARVHAIGDHADSAEQMGVPVDRVRVTTFAFVGVGSALAGIFTTLVNFTWWPTTGDGYLLPGITSVFVGGTPTWGGVGTIAGGVLGTVITTFIQSGVVAAGANGFYVQFFNGLIIILALFGHRWNQKRYR